jgi:hypothetical protein
MPDAPPGIPISNAAAYWARVYFGVTVPLIVLCIATTATRVIRKIKGKLWWDDWLILLGFVSCHTCEEEEMKFAERRDLCNELGRLTLVDGNRPLPSRTGRS